MKREFQIRAGFNQKNTLLTVYKTYNLKNHDVECPKCHSVVEIRDNIGACHRCKLEILGPIFMR